VEIAAAGDETAVFVGVGLGFHPLAKAVGEWVFEECEYDTAVPVGMGFGPGGGAIGPTGPEGGDGPTGCTGATGVLAGGGLGGGAMGLVGPAGPSGSVLLWQLQFLGGVSATLITAGTGTDGFAGAGSANGEPEVG
jgi:hypothetical protein